MHLKIKFVFPPYLYNIWREQGSKGFKQIMLIGDNKTFTGVNIGQSMVKYKYHLPIVSATFVCLFYFICIKCVKL